MSYKKLVIIESPFAGKTPQELEENLTYARACIKDSLLRGEAPIASHLLYTQPGILDDDKPEERELGIESGLAWLEVADLSAVYTDRGISTGMRHGINSADKRGVTVEIRSILALPHSR